MEVSVKFTSACRTDTGRVRQNNEDNFVEEPGSGLFAVCDGMGGHNAGEVASHLAGQSVAQRLGQTPIFGASPGQAMDFEAMAAAQRAMVEAFAYANQRIFDDSRADTQHSGMGTTCTALALLPGGKAVLGHVGDSRLYLLREGHLLRLTDDHTYVYELVQRGALSPAEMHDHPQGNVLSRAMGVQKDVYAQVYIFDTDPGDTFLLCTDGVYNYFDGDVGLATLMGHAHLATGLSAIVDTALRRGGHDNCTGILLRLHDETTTPGQDKTSTITAPLAFAPSHAGTRSMQRLSEIAALLTNVPPLASLTPVQEVQVLGMGQRHVHGAGTVLVEPGGMVAGLTLVVSGGLQIYDGRDVVRHVPPGAAIGQLCLLGPMPQAHRIVVDGDTTVWTLTHRAFGHLARHNPRLGSALMGPMLTLVDDHRARPK